MKNITIIALPLLCLGLHANAQTQNLEANDNRLEGMDIDMSALAKWGTRVFNYQIERNGKTMTLGTVNMKTIVDEAEIQLKDKWNLDWKGKKIMFDAHLNCAPTIMMRPTRIVSKGSGDDEVKQYTAAIAEKEAVVSKKGAEDKTMEFPADTLTDLAMFRVFTLLPFKKGLAVKVGHTLEVSELNLKKECSIEYKGEGSVVVNEQELTLHKFVHKRSGRVVQEAWVDENRNLRQIRIDGRKLLTEVQKVEKPVVKKPNAVKNEFLQIDAVQINVVIDKDKNKTKLMNLEISLEIKPNLRKSVEALKPWIRSMMIDVVSAMKYKTLIGPNAQKTIKKELKALINKKLQSVGKGGVVDVLLVSFMFAG